MTAFSIEKVGLVAHYSEQGDWAFNAAFEFARRQDIQLNTFYFLRSSFDMPQDKAPGEAPAPEITDKLVIAAERKLREYYDERLGDYVKAGFKVCESVRHNLELRSCLMKQDFHILYIPYLYSGVPFGNMPIEEFAFRFHAPVVLVGPESENEFHVNPPAHMAMEAIHLPEEMVCVIKKPEHFQELPVL